MQCREEYARGVRDFARHFGRVAAALIIGFIQGLFVAWLAWLFWFAAVETWTVLTSPAFIAGAELMAFIGIISIWKIFRPGRPGERGNGEYGRSGN
jgi:hypothetical protein